MKTFIPSIITSGLWVIAPLKAAPPIGQVTLPYQQFVELTHKPEVSQIIKPPIAAVLSRADYLIDISKGDAVVSVDWHADNFSDSWAWVAVASSDLAIEPEGESTLVAHDGEIRLLMSNSGPQLARARFPVPSGLGIAARFPILPATFNSIRIRSDDKSIEYQIDGATLLADENGELRHLLPATAHEVIIRKSETQDDEQRPETWSISASAWVVFDAGWIDHEVRLSATPTGGSGVNMQLPFPNTPSRLEVKSENLLEYEKNEAGLLLRWGNRDAGERSITLRYRTQITGDDTKWTLKMPSTDAGSTVVVRVPQGAEIIGKEWIHDPNPSRLPAWLQTLSEEEKIVMSVGKPTEVEVKWLPRIDTASMTIEEATISTRIVADGSQLTTTTYQVTHANGGSALWTLPEGMTLLDATVSGTRISPIDRESALEFDLPKPAQGRPTIVAFSYTGSGKALDRVAGGLVVETPSSPLFAHRINWNIVLPDGNKLEAVESNAETASAPAGASAGSAWLKRMLTRGEPLRAEIFYRSNSSDN